MMTQRRLLNQQAAQQGMVGIAQLQELSRGGQVEEGLHQRVQRDAQHRGQQRAAGAPQAFANTSAMEVLVINPMVRMMTMLAMAVRMPQSSTCWR